MNKRHYRNLTNIPPLIRLSLQLIEHAVEHILESTPFGSIVSLIHADQAVDLILKQKVMEIKPSIFKKGGRVIGIKEAIELIGHENIPESSDLEYIHALRNDCQHLGIILDINVSRYYVEKIRYFIARFTEDEFNMNYFKILGEEEQALNIGPQATPLVEPSFNELIDEAKSLYENKQHISSILMLFSAIEIYLDDFEVSADDKTTVEKLREYLKQHESPSKVEFVLENLRKIRNKAAHGELIINKEVDYIFDFIEWLKLIE